MIKIQNLNKYYNKGKDNEIHVINDVSIELPSEGFISFFGPSGSGKTTLLNVIGGLDKAKGIITYDDFTNENYQMSKVDRFRGKEIGYVFQNYNLLLEETVYDNLAIALDLMGVYDKEEVDKRIIYTLKAVGMYKYRKKRTYALSGGQQQRVSIARALVKNCKIIIADEPTGNLDSENTIEIMNILKKISKKTLVLMVTHNEEVARFYSDQVIEIKDGRIEDYYCNDSSSQTLNTTQNNKIYLKDLNHIEGQTEVGQLDLYYDQTEVPHISLQVIVKNGNVYIQSNQKIKLIENTNFQVLDTHYESMKQANLEDFQYDTSWYNNHTTNKGLFWRILQKIKTSFNKMRFIKKRMKFIYFSLFLIGILFAICCVGYANYSVIDDSNMCYDDNYKTAKSKEYVNYSIKQAKVSELLIGGAIDQIAVPQSFTASAKKRLNLSQSLSYTISGSLIGYKPQEKYSILVGTEPQRSEMLLSSSQADLVMRQHSYYFNSYDDLIGEKVSLASGIEVETYTICGVSSNPSKLSYIHQKDYLLLLEHRPYVSRLLPFFRDYSIESTENYKSYTITSGRDLTEDDYNQDTILVSATSLYAGEEYLNELVIIDSHEYLVVGVFEFKDFSVAANDYITYSTKPYNVYNSICHSTTDYEISIIAGRNIEKYNECLASVYSKYRVGDVVGGVEVVGVYNGEAQSHSLKCLYSDDYIIFSANAYDMPWFVIQDKAAVEKVFSEDTFSIISIYESYANTIIKNQKATMMVFGIFSISLLAIIAIFIYFIMRSRLIGDIYRIGVYRSLGAPRYKIVLQFLSDIIITTTLTSLIGFAITTFIFNTIAGSINNMYFQNILKTSNMITFLGIVLLYGMSILFGLIPVYTLMRKSPAEIISKYDI